MAVYCGLLKRDQELLNPNMDTSAIEETDLSDTENEINAREAQRLSLTPSLCDPSKTNGKETDEFTPHVLLDDEDNCNFSEEPHLSPQPTEIERSPAIFETSTNGGFLSSDRTSEIQPQSDAIGTERLIALKKIWDVKKDESSECVICHKNVYAAEKLSNDGLVFHKGCFKCSVCGVQLRLETSEKHLKKVYCKNHYRQALTNA